MSSALRSGAIESVMVVLFIAWGVALSASLLKPQTASSAGNEAMARVEVAGGNA